MFSVLMLAVLHYLGDFILQSHKMSMNKSKDNAVLFQHVIAYCSPFILIIFLEPNHWAGPVFVVANLVLHFCTDYCTSRWSSRLWKKNEYHWFFCVIGFDQLIHMTTLVLTFNYLIKVI
jgi:Protein of unknown function (DUF3307)